VVGSVVVNVYTVDPVQPRGFSNRPKNQILVFDINVLRVESIACHAISLAFTNSVQMSNYYDITSCVTLNDGNQYPRLGLGVYESEPGEETYNAVTYALEAGYRQSEFLHLSLPIFSPSVV
jgi:hypothetical protein